MTDAPQSTAAVFPGTVVLDDLDLLRAGLVEPPSASVPEGAATVVDAEGVPVARIDEDRRITWLARRSSRPFEGHHLQDRHIALPAVLVNDDAGVDAVQPDITSIVLLASTDGDDSDADVALARHARDAAERIGAALHIAPVGAASSQWRNKVDSIREALGGPGAVRDLTTGPTPQTRRRRASHDSRGAGVVVLFSGLSGSGKSTLARALRNRLVETTSAPVSLLDGDIVRRNLSTGLTFSVEDRETNVRRIGWVAAEIARHGGRAIASPIAPFERTRREVAQMVHSRGGHFVLVHVATPLEECERRDRKGLYAAARRGEIPDFTGIGSPYEPPATPTLRLDTTGRSVEPMVDEILQAMSEPRTAEPQPEPRTPS